MVRLPHTPAEVARGQRLGALLRHARGERSMLEIALDAGVSPETLRKIETGRVSTPAFPTIAAIAEVLGLSLDVVWAEVNRPDVDSTEVGGAEVGRPERGVEPTGSRRGARERLAS
ncbi:helix-turn-helix domain-containing protein [Compostimonas suwonensis]|uniref:Helix-turn-helix protein n=1 Tax=Compostimonas suwonensis TaxID=1048394 RepID=A0A2M9BZ90_9MICO|nr:helix-turn-helix transcriptional regulator [Compostimonas suwonensis]PJJ63394.1 helix-turn-helix protein [Compostimonas suwonensis]